MKKISVFIFSLLTIFLFSNNIVEMYIENFDKLENEDIDKFLVSIENTNNDILKLIHGSLLVKKSNYEWFFPLKYYYVYVGMLEMKEVVKSDFDNLLYRYLRGKTAYEIKYYDFAKNIFIKDFEYIYIRSNDEFRKKYDFGEILFKLYKIYKTNNPIKSKKYLTELKHLKNSKYYRLIENEE